MYEITIVQSWSLVVMNLQRIISDSAAPLGFTELYSEFQLIVYLSGCNFTVLVHSQRLS